MVDHRFAFMPTSWWQMNKASHKPPITNSGMDRSTGSFGSQSSRNSAQQKKGHYPGLIHLEVSWPTGERGTFPSGGSLMFSSGRETVLIHHWAVAGVH